MSQEPLILAIETSSRMGSVAIALGANVVSEIRFSGPLMHSVEIFPALRGLLNRIGRTARQVEQVYISGGPGSFTGLRIAATIAKIMHLANAAKIITVDTLDIITANVVRLETMGEWCLDSRPSSIISRPSLPGGCERIAAILDAKRGQFFIAVYERCTDGTKNRQDPRFRGDKLAPAEAGEIWEKTVPDSLMTISEFLDRFAGRASPIGLLGDGLVYYKDKFKADGVYFWDEEHWSPRANKVHLLGWPMALKGQFTDPLTLTPNYLRKPDVTLKPR